MVATRSNMLPLGSKASNFTLIDTRTKQFISLEDYKSPIATVIMFLSNHCPYVKHIQAKCVALAEIYQKKGLKFIGISANDAEKYPTDGPEQMHIEAEQFNYCFPYLYDETQEVAKAYKAACTPDFYVFDKDLLCVYRGRFDESTPVNNKPVTGADLQKALDSILAKEPVSVEQKQSLGCSIKWK